MKHYILGAFIALCLSVAPALSVTLTANFDTLPLNSSPGLSYSENGLHFTSPTQFGVATGSFGAVLFGWGGYVYQGNALYVSNGGWVCLTAGGAMTSVQFNGGFDWNGYLIEYDQLDVYFEWCAMLNGQEVASAVVPISYPGRKAHQFGGSVTPGVVFDELLMRSTAVIYQPGRQSGEVVTYRQTDSPANHLALDNVRVVRVPDGANTLPLLLSALLCLGLFRRL